MMIPTRGAKNRLRLGVACAFGLTTATAIAFSATAGPVKPNHDRPAVTEATAWVIDGSAEFALPGAPQLRLAETQAVTPGPSVVRFDELLSDDAVRQALGLSADAVIQPLVKVQQSKRFLPNDPLFSDQWHLNNTGQNGGTIGEDAHVTGVWGDPADTGYTGFTGNGIVIGVVDDGVQYTHPDLADRYRNDLDIDINFNDNDALPSASNEDFHGTAVAGVAAATGNNNVGVTGVAPGASLTGIRLISAETDDFEEAQGLSHRRDEIDIYNNSWGPADDGVAVAPGLLTRQALEDGVNLGRDGKGSIFVWAGGNGREDSDNVNYDGYANSRYTIAVGAIDDRGVQAYYSEPGAPLLVVAHSDSDFSGITTTDLTGRAGYNRGSIGGGDYTDDFGGTSSSTPVVAGVVALMLEANPELTWRDVQHVLVETARQNDPSHPDWTLNAAGHEINHSYGFGAVDADAAVAAAQIWTNVGPEQSISTGVMPVNQAVPDDFGPAVVDTVNVAEDLTLEWVEVVFNMDHTYIGDLEIILTHDTGDTVTTSILSQDHEDSNADYEDWVFTSARHWGESALGEWSLSVQDVFNGDTGTWLDWTLNLYGTAVEALLNGDFNADGFVSQADLDLVLLNWGESTLPDGWIASEQFDGQLVSQNELDLVLLNWGDGEPGPSFAAIPEPASAAVLGVCGLFWMRRQPRG